MPFDYIVSNNGEYIIDENGNYIINGESDVTDISINYHTVISFPDDPIASITTGIEAGSLLVNRILYASNIRTGEINSDRFEVTIYGIDDITGKKIYVYQQHNVNPSDIIPIFTGIVDSCKTDRNEYYRKIVAYDEFYTKGNLDVVSWWDTFWNTHGTGATIATIRSELLSNYNITVAPDEVAATFINDDVTVLQFPGISSLKLGTLLSYITELNGVNPYFDEQGYLRFYNPKYSPTSHDINGKFESQNTDFEKFITAAVDNVTLLGEANSISGSYIPSGSSSENIYFIKDNPLVFNIIPPTGQTQPDVYNSICEQLYGIVGDITVSYTPAKIKMILSDISIKLGDHLTATVKDNDVTSIVSQVTVSGSLLIEQSFISAGNEKQAVADYNTTAGQISEVKEEAKKVSEHFVWVQGDGAYVTTDATPAGSAPTTNFSKLTSQGLDVTAQGKDVAFFGVIGNDDLPFTRLGLEDGAHIEIDNDSLEMKTAHQDPFFHVGKGGGTEVSHTDTQLVFGDLNISEVYSFNSSTTLIVKVYTDFFDRTFTTNTTVQCGILWGDNLQYGLDNYIAPVQILNLEAGLVGIQYEQAFITALMNTANYSQSPLSEGMRVTVKLYGTYTYTQTEYNSSLVFGDHINIGDNGDYSAVIGLRNTTTGRFSVALGAENNVSGEVGFAAGYGNTVSENYGFAIGAALTVSSPAQVVVGKYNIPVPNAPFIVGSGYANLARNALWIDSENNTHLGGQLITPTIGSYWNMPDLKWNDINPQSGVGSGDTIELRAVGSNQQSLALIDVNGNHHVLSNEQGGFIPEKADVTVTNLLEANKVDVSVYNTIGTKIEALNESVTSNTSISLDEDLPIGTYMVIMRVEYTHNQTAGAPASPFLSEFQIRDGNVYLDELICTVERNNLSSQYVTRHLAVSVITTTTTKSLSLVSSFVSEDEAIVQVEYIKMK